ncbi:hypothetical protein FF011L_13540 [Roseimaritima multifibrata]|uniref:SGNH hydrolase-type esterase domain-containing protein n=1 Tax=Roseimaritima multifibrata TaxID=1930274 RepID=A0A517MCV3_9BACT|nr:SGNH/GDSL hydrolase family protein [Roseimaritima multifibrata]QDS92607.1 hypothetical protein FF011L_13540 [Roseimaritima multifibrata]
MDSAEADAVGTTSKSKRRRWWIFGFVAAGLILGTLGYVEWFLKRPVGEGPAGPEIARQPFEKIWSEQTIQIVGIGDSVTAGLGAKNPSHSYYNRLRENPEDEFESMRGISLSAVLPNLQHQNFAVSGSESLAHEQMVNETVPDYPAETFGIILMSSGGNDLIHSYGRRPPRECAMYGATLAEAEPWIEAFGIRLAGMFEKLNERFPGGCEIYCADIYDPTDGVGDAPSIFLPHWPDGLAIHAKYNQTIRSVAESFENVFVVPLYENFLGHGSHCRQFWQPHYDAQDPYYWFYDNVEDPNDRGYDAIRRLYLKTIVENTSLR